MVFVVGNCDDRLTCILVVMVLVLVNLVRVQGKEPGYEVECWYMMMIMCDLHVGKQHHHNHQHHHHQYEHTNQLSSS